MAPKTRGTRSIPSMVGIMCGGGLGRGLVGKEDSAVEVKELDLWLVFGVWGGSGILELT